MAPRDPVTDLPGGAHFDRQLNSMLFHAEREGREISVSILDVRGLKAINRDLGWSQGDRVLREFAAAMTSEAPADSHLWHLGGDAFVVALAASSAGGAGDFLGRMSRAAALIEAGPQSLTFAAGTAMFPLDGRTAKALLRVADARMHAQRG